MGKLLKWRTDVSLAERNTEIKHPVISVSALSPRCPSAVVCTCLHFICPVDMLLCIASVASTDPPSVTLGLIRTG